MKVTIWDLDYYYSKKKVNCFNPDVMKISSYHKQCGDSVMLVRTVDDIHRPYDIYYMIKENDKTPMPPLEFFVNPKVKWWGKAVKRRINWKMSDAMLGCRPDYLIYPEHNTKEERSEQIRLFNNAMQLLPATQDWTNTFTNKYVIVTDPVMWYATPQDILFALNKLRDVKKLSFLEPIWIEKLLSDEKLIEAFLELKFSPGSKISWSVLNPTRVDEMINFYLRFKEKHPQVSCGDIVIDWTTKNKDHWENRNDALEDFELLKRNIVKCKQKGIAIKVRMPATRFETPYYELFEFIAKWTQSKFSWSWLEYITVYTGNIPAEDGFDYYWKHPNKWTEIFRDLLRQTYEDQDFLLLQMKDKNISRLRIPWDLWKEQFKYGI